MNLIHNHPSKFAKLLSLAIRRIAAENNRTITATQREIGNAIGRNSQHTVDYWRRGHIPQETTDVEHLARELVHRKGIQNIEELEQFLEYAQVSHRAALITELTACFLPQPHQRNSHQGGTFKTAPFINGRPICYPHQFFGRRQCLERIFHQLDHLPLQHLAIYGPRSSGKTSLLYYLKTIETALPGQLRPNQKQGWLSQPDAYRWVYIDFQDNRMKKQETLLQAILRGLGLHIPTPCNLADFMQVVETNLTTPSIILMDEIEQVILSAGELQDGELWTSLRSLACDEFGERLGFILASKEMPHQLARNAPNGLATFLGIFGQTMELGAFTETEARQLIASSPYPFPSNDVNWILEQSQCWPVLLQVMCLARWNMGETNDDAWKIEALKQSLPYAFLLNPLSPVVSLTSTISDP